MEALMLALLAILMISRGLLPIVCRYRSQAGVFHELTLKDLFQGAKGTFGPQLLSCVRRLITIGVVCHFTFQDYILCLIPF